MRKRWTIWVLAGCGLAALIVVLAFPTERQPEYNGRKLSEWLKLYVQSQDPQAADAVRHIGTNALPWLLEWTDYQPPGWKMRLWTNPPVAMLRTGYARSVYYWLLRSRASDREWPARSGFEILGSVARPALPELERRLADWQKPWRASLAMELYAQIEGPGSVPALVRALASTNTDSRKAAAFCLATLSTNAAPAAPALRNALKDPEWFVREMAAKALQQIAPEAPSDSTGQKNR